MPAAIRDLDEIVERIAEQNLDAAIRFCLALEHDERQLADFPGMGTRRSFRNSSFPELRSWPIGGFREYLLFYRPVPEGIELVSIIHGARDIDAFFASR